MEYTRLGQTGMKVSKICLGCMTYGSPKWRDWILDETASRPFFDRAFDLGINFFDTADVYSIGASEEVTGKMLKDMAKRDQVVIATKVCSPMGKGANESGLSRKHIMESVDASLKRLGTDYVDLYQIHRWDYETPIEETVEALSDVVKAGKALYIGASSMYAWQFMKALGHQRKHGLAKFVSMQNHYNLVYREEEREMNPLCFSEGIGLIPWSPMARGFLTGNRKPGDKDSGETSRAKTDDIAQNYYYRDSDFKVVEALSALAREKGVSNATLAYAWLLHKGVTAPIVGASKTYQLDDAVAALELALAAEEVARLEAAYEPHPVLGHT